MPNKKYVYHSVLVKFWRALFIFLLFVSLFSTVFGVKNNCKIISDDDTLECNVKNIEQNFRVANISFSPFASFSRVFLKCKENFIFESFLDRDTFSDLGRVTNIQISNCKIGELNSDVFLKLQNLKSFSLRTQNFKESEKFVRINKEIFRPLSSLEDLDLSTNNIWELPQGVFCSLHNLKYLNVSHNHIQDLTQLGFTGPLVSAINESTTCTSDIITLDISFNDAGGIGPGALKGLTRLEELKISSNKISKIDDDAFDGLESLSTLDLSNNKLVALPENAFLHTPNLMYVVIRNNSLSVLSPRLFSGLEHLVTLDLSHNDLKSDLITETSFQELIRLVVLDLSHNKLTQLKPQLFRDLYSVQELRLSHNQLTTIPASAFKPCVNLHTLLLSHNNIQDISENAFDGVDFLSFLSLDNNDLITIDKNAFANLKNLQDLNINGNLFTHVPEAISSLRSLKTLDLGDNKISNMADLPLNGLEFLYGLRLANNSISGTISKDTFANISSLKILNLSRNKITYIEPQTFVKNKNLQAIRLDANNLASMEGLFNLLPKLEWLNVSDNHIENFDYYYFPPTLLYLDVHKNRISELSNSLGRNELSLQTLDASYNNLHNVSSIQIPKSIRLAFLNDNKISSVEQYTFLNKENLTRVDLYSNNLTKMDMQALRLIPVPADKPLPQFYLGGNSFVCDCHMEWLQRINNLKHDRYYPTIMDLENIKCQMPFIRGDVSLPLMEVEPSQFLCKFESHCFTLCHCCEFDACDCEMTCPEGCSCFHDQSWRSNIVNCSSNDLTNVPERIPMDATEVHLDGNNFKNLSSHSFIGRKHIQIIYVNSSNVETLDNGTFSGLTRLTELHLENNLIEILKGHEFKFLKPLRELYLHKNRLQYIHQHTFMDMSHLEILTLHDNKLVNFPIWRMVDNPYLMKISLANNPWSCECQFFESFEIWIIDNSKKVFDNNEIKCISSDSSSDSYAIDFNVTNCLNSSLTSTVIQPMIMHNLLHPVIAVSVAFVVMVILLICFLYRHTLKVWFFSRYGFRICHKQSPQDDRDKIFDAFISYSSKDEVWVNQVLAAQLERTEKPYRICLHYRDFPVTAYITETMVEAVESSKRTIIVVSKNFIENEWCRFQFKSAHHEVLKKKRKNIIVIVLGDIPSRDLDPELRLYLKTNTCIRSNDKLFWDKLRFAMPDVCLGHRTVHTYSTIPDRSGTNKYSVNTPSSLHRNNIQTYDAYWA